MRYRYLDFLIRSSGPEDRLVAGAIIKDTLAEYQISWFPDGLDKDALTADEYYKQFGGEFWVIERNGNIVGTGAYCRSDRGENTAEIRRMYLIPSVRKMGLGRVLLQKLEETIQNQGFKQGKLILKCIKFT